MTNVVCVCPIPDFEMLTAGAWLVLPGNGMAGAGEQSEPGTFFAHSLRARCIRRKALRFSDLLQ